MARASGLPYMHCRFCGTRFKKSEVSEHELECLEKSEEQFLENSMPYSDNNINKTSSNVTPLKGGRAKTGNTTGSKATKFIQKSSDSDSPSPSTSEEHPFLQQRETSKRYSTRNKKVSPETAAGTGKMNQKSDNKGRTSERNNSASVNPSSFTSEQQPLPQQNQMPKNYQSKEKETLKDVAYPKVSAEMMREAENSDVEPLPGQDSLPVNALVKNDPKQAWNANAPRKMSGKLDDPFPPVRKYRHYPVSCEFCNKKFQPGPLRKHIQKYHPDEHLPPEMRGRDQGRIRPPDPREEVEEKKRPASGPPRQMKICYICGRMFGSKSIHIHEPKCLEKWRIQNENLPKSKRMPEPVKPEAMPGSSEGESLSGSNQDPQQNLPELDAEAEAAYRSHLKNLVPCTYCGRTFNPDRVMVHENACIERPRKKKRRVRK
ncbi:Zinc finger protein 474 [Araneus ventricosus]|uniref:Zinc finger protein 474 n=1 Tax=Araneus ventricosus TaxID=182803 RepID=A0A4Y2GDM2_ARAVE|nr:Zinc finger protein 474 [Araneus ventricosus]